MGNRKSRDGKLIDSHIQMPKLLLKRFHNTKNQFCYYDVDGGFVGTRGSADSTNTENGYYSGEAARNGISIAIQNKIFEEYILTFIVNRTKIPFVLPLAGIYSYSLNKHSIINLPISPKIAICLVHKNYSKRLIHEDGTISMFEVKFADIIMKMNSYAFSSQKERNWGRVICPSREELDRLVKYS